MEGKQLYLFGFGRDSNENKLHSKVIFHFDTLILSGVVIILLLVLSFSLGVEKGKKVTLANLSSSVEIPSNISNLPQEKVKITEKTKKNIKKEKTQTKVQNVEKKEPKNIEKKKQNRYRIQVASFKKKITAEKTAKLLKQKGYPVSIIKKGSYMVVYVDGFNTEIEAKDNLEILREKYKDCILRRL